MKRTVEQDMKLLRFRTVDKKENYGWLMDERVGLIEGDLFGEYRRLETSFPLRAVQVLEPVQPSKIICMGRNFHEHAKEQGAEVPDVPMLFIKPASALLAHNGTILLPPQSHQVEHEAELVVVIGKRGRWISIENANKYILGYTIGNDVTARDLQHRDGQWTRGKGFDTFCPVGPYIETDLDPADTLITCKVNSELRQMASTKEMVFTIPQLVAFVSSVMTLEPGDLIFTGTPAGVGPLNDGDRVEITIEGIGTLVNQVGLEKR
jgi:2-keto-4-pentenoate hydratase/2-oxohepta-3-ene-1,7-dioic acid hydratase in catechol pathway